MFNLKANHMLVFDSIIDTMIWKND